MRLAVLVALGAHAGLLAQLPFVYIRGVVNGASYMTPGLPGGAIAQGSVFTIFGSNLGPATSPGLAFPLQNTLGGVSVTVTSGSSVVNAIPIYVGPSQIMASCHPIRHSEWHPWESPYNARSNIVPVGVTDSSFGIFTANSSGSGPGILYNFVTTANQPINSLQQSATPGQVLTLWGTGLGAVTFPGNVAPTTSPRQRRPDNVAPTTGNLAVLTEAFVGGKIAKVNYNGRSSCCAGLDQIVLEVPADAPLGCWVPVYVGRPTREARP